MVDTKKPETKKKKTGKKKKQKWVYIVGDYGPEHTFIKSVHGSRKGALKAWNEHRLLLKNSAKEWLKRCQKTGRDNCMIEILEREIKNLSCKSPKEISNYPHDTPFLWKYELLD